MDYTVKVLKEKPDSITILVGGQVMELSHEYLKRYMDRSIHDPLETVIRNIALSLSLDKVDLASKTTTLTSVLDNKVFKGVD